MLSEINKDYYCSAGYLFDHCMLKNKISKLDCISCHCRHCKHPTPEQFKGSRYWNVAYDVRNTDFYYIICANLPEPPPDDFVPEEKKK